MSFTSALETTAQTLTEPTIYVAGTPRQIRVYAPKNLPENAPLIISMHGMNQDPEYQMNTTKWNAVADTARCLVVYPYGINKAWDISGDSDVNFIKAIINNMYNKYKINKNRVYATGFSMGGMMTYHLITRMAGQIAAFAPVSGIPVDNRNPSGTRHVPLIHHHGSADDTVKFGGDPYHPAGGYRPISDYVTAWAKWNGCDMANPTVKMYGNDKSTRWVNEKEGIETVYNICDGVGHWHSNNEWGGIYTTKEIWNFVRRYSLNGDFSLAPTINTITPRENSTTLKPKSTIYLTFMEKVDVAQIEATLEGCGQVIELINKTLGTMKDIIKFQVPEDTKFIGGDYTLNVRNVNSASGGHKDLFTFSYPIATGIEDIMADAKSPICMYTIAGTKADASSRGIVVVDGKKYLKQ